MELKHNYQVGFNELLTEKFDYFIAVSGYQKRSLFLAENTRFREAEKFVLSYDESNYQKLRQENDAVFQRLGFIPIKTASDSTVEVEKLIQKIFGCKACLNLNVLIDYSCMPKTWYATIINYLIRNDFNAKRINIFFSYTAKKNNVVLQKSRLKTIEPIFVQNDSMIDKKPVALVAGLNNNHGIVKELIEKLKPTDTTAFVPDFSHDNQYYEKVVETNADILKNVNSEKVYKYPAHRPDQIGSMLTSLCLDLRLKSSVVLVPHGPKTLGLASILLSVRYPDIKIYDLLPKDDKHIPDIGLPSGDPVIVKSAFILDDEEEDY